MKNAKAGQVQFRVDKAGIVHSTIGRRSFDSDKLQGNLQALMDALNKAKPASSKGIYLRKVALSSTMGVGARVDVSTITLLRSRAEMNEGGARSGACPRIGGLWRGNLLQAVKDRRWSDSSLNEGQTAGRTEASADGVPAVEGNQGFRDGKVAGCVGGANARRHVLREEQTLSLNRNEKEAVVTDVAAQVARSQTLALAEYRGLTVEHMNKLRVDARAKGVYLHVLKNSLARRAVAGTPFECAAEAMSGPLIYSFSEDAVAAAKVIADFAKGNDKLVVKAGAYAGKALDANGVKALEQYVLVRKNRDITIAGRSGPRRTPRPVGPGPVVVRLRPRRSARARQVVMAVAAVAAAGIVAVPLVNGVLSRSGDDSSSGAGAASDAAGVREGPQESGVRPRPSATSLSRSGTSYTAATLATAAGRCAPARRALEHPRTCPHRRRVRGRAGL